MYLISRSFLVKTIPPEFQKHFNLLPGGRYVHGSKEYDLDATNFATSIRGKQVFVWCGDNLGNLRTFWIYFEICFCLHSAGSLLALRKDQHNIQLICDYLRIPVVIEEFDAFTSKFNLVVFRAVNTPYEDHPLLISYLIVLWILYTGHISPIGHNSIFKFQNRHYISLKRLTRTKFERDWIQKVNNDPYPYVHICEHKMVFNPNIAEFITNAYSSNNGDTKWDTELWRHASFYNPWLAKGYFHSFEASRCINLLSISGKIPIQVRLFKTIFSRTKGPYIGMPPDEFKNHLSNILCKEDSPVMGTNTDELAESLSLLDIGDGAGSSPPWPIDRISTCIEAGQKIVLVHLAWARHKGNDPMNQGISVMELFGHTGDEREELEPPTIKDQYIPQHYDDYRMTSADEYDREFDSQVEQTLYREISRGPEGEVRNEERSANEVSSPRDFVINIDSESQKKIETTLESILPLKTNLNRRTEMITKYKDLFNWLSITTMKLLDTSNMMKELSKLLANTVDERIYGNSCLFYWATSIDEYDLESKLILACSGILKTRIPKKDYQFEEFTEHGIQTMKSKRFILFTYFKRVNRNGDAGNDEMTLVKGVFPLITIVFLVAVFFSVFAYLYNALDIRKVNFEDAASTIVAILALVFTPYFTVVHPALYRNWSILGSLSGHMTPKDSIDHSTFKCIAGKHSEIKEMTFLKRANRLNDLYNCRTGQSFIGSVPIQGRNLQYTYRIRELTDLIQFGYDLRGVLYVFIEGFHSTWLRLQFIENQGFHTVNCLGGENERQDDLSVSLFDSESDDDISEKRLIRRFRPIGIFAEHRLL